MAKKTIYDIAFILLLTSVCHFLFSKYGFNPTDEGFVLSAANRVMHGQIPHVDFSSVRPLGYAYLHIPELLFSKKYVLLISRFVFWLEQVLIAYLWIRWLIRITHRTIPVLYKYSLIVICFIFNVHYFPASVLHTIDGLLMCLIGLNLIIRKDNWKYIGFIFIGFAALCKQNYLVVLPVALLLFGRRNLLINLIFGICPIFIYVGIISFLGGYENLKIQLFSHSEILNIGILPYFNSHLFWSGILWILILFVIKNRVYKFFVLLFLYAVCFYSLYTGTYHEKYGFFIFGSTLGCLIISTLQEEKNIVKLLLINIVLAWCVSISIGYNTPALFIGGCLSTLTFYLILEKSILYKFLSAILIPLIVIFYFIRTHYIYREQTSYFLTYKLDNITEGAHGIFTNKNTFQVLAELDSIKRNTNNSIITTDFTACNIVHSHLSKLNTEWANKTEIPNKNILEKVTHKINHDTSSIVLLSKYNLAILNSGFVKIDTNKTNKWLIMQYIFQHYDKRSSTKYFDIYLRRK
jgi:hypothetical protein